MLFDFKAISMPLPEILIVGVPIEVARADVAAPAVAEPKLPSWLSNSKSSRKSAIWPPPMSPLVESVLTSVVERETTQTAS